VDVGELDGGDGGDRDVVALDGEHLGVEAEELPVVI